MEEGEDRGEGCNCGSVSLYLMVYFFDAIAYIYAYLSVKEVFGCINYDYTALLFVVITVAAGYSAYV